MPRLVLNQHLQNHRIDYDHPHPRYLLLLHKVDPKEIKVKSDKILDDGNHKYYFQIQRQQFLS